MAWTLAEVAAWVGGTVLGDDQTLVVGAAPQGAAKANEITLIDSSERAKRRGAGSAAAAIVPQDVELPGVPLIRVDDAHAAFATVVAHFRPPRTNQHVGTSPQAYVSPSAQVDPTASIHPTATIGDDVEIAAGAVIYPGVRILAGSRIGADTTIYPNVVLYENTVVGARVTIHAGAIIGAHGFGYRNVAGRHERCAQLGYVQIDDDVEIGANTTIDRGTFGPTVIGEGTKIDNLVMIAHNCQIGKHNLLCSQVGIAGSSTTGDYVIMGGQVGVRDHATIGEGAILGAQCGVHTDVTEGQHLLGSPAIPEREFWVQQVAIAKLPELRKHVRSLERQLAELQARLKDTAS